MSDTLNAEPPLRATLYQLGLRSADPERLAAFYTQGFGYRFSPSGDGVLGVARDRRLAIVPGAATTLDHAAYAVSDAGEIDAIERRLAAAGVPVRRIAAEGFEADALTFHDPDGNRFLFGVAAGTPYIEGDAVADRAARIQHVVFASTNLQRLLDFFTEVVGFTLSDRVIDEHGGLRTVFLRCSHEHHSLALFAAGENRLDHHCYEATEWNLIRDWGDHFARHRVPLKWGPGRHGPGDNLFLFIHDPDGNWVEISAELEHVEPDRPIGEWPHEEYTLNTWGIGLLRS